MTDVTNVYYTILNEKLLGKKPLGWSNRKIILKLNLEECGLFSCLKSWSNYALSIIRQWTSGFYKKGVEFFQEVPDFSCPNEKSVLRIQFCSLRSCSGRNVITDIRCHIPLQWENFVPRNFYSSCVASVTPLEEQYRHSSRPHVKRFV
jgi:hypothetical protein